MLYRAAGACYSAITHHWRRNSHDSPLTSVVQSKTFNEAFEIFTPSHFDLIDKFALVFLYSGDESGAAQDLLQIIFSSLQKVRNEKAEENNRLYFVKISYSL